ncbi:uncharacterized protein LOC143279401 [Babylonia areolata]|uniref:uncharacterized protein LOC143279401 n=1 Tax=Babylonia areolata TaxID=304850 RepID=UPI003FD1A30B
MQTTTMLLITMMMMTAVSVHGQSQCPPRSMERCAEINGKRVIDAVVSGQQDVFREFYCVDYSQLDSRLYHQLCITEAEAAAACKAVNASVFIKSGGATAPHPRSCFAYLDCTGHMFNPTRVNTIYYYGVQIKTTTPETYYNPVTHQVENWNTDNNCTADPCKTNRAMTTGRECNKYLTCNNGYVPNTCPQFQGFNPFLGTCVANPSCTPAIVRPTDNIRCYATGRPVNVPAIPGVPDNAYYNRTFRFTATGEEVTRQEMCPAGLVFDSHNPNCTQRCLDCCVLQPVDPCPNVTLIKVGVNTGQPWAQVRQNDTYTFTVNSQGWVCFDRTDFSYYDGQALANNELAGNWDLAFRFYADPSGNNPTAFVVMQNSHDPIACPNPSLVVSVNGSCVIAVVTARLTGTNQHLVSVRLVLCGVVSRASLDPTEVVLQRRGGTLTLKAKLQSQPQFQQTSGSGLGGGLLPSTRCGLIVGQYFIGCVESVKLVKYGC